MQEVRLEEVQRFMEDSLMAVGAPEEEAAKQAALLLHADITGHFSHGLNRLELYINDIKANATSPLNLPVILKETVATAWVDGQGALGATVGNFCMDVAIKKAKDCGIGWVTVKDSNHFGMAGYWAQKAEKEGLIGMAFTNSAPLLVPTRAKQSALGTNPISFAAPASNGDSFLNDMATTTAAMGKVEVQIHKEQDIPYGWALGPDGQPTTDAKLAFDTGKLMPLGGFEETSGYKGYGLSAMVEILCTCLSGAKFTHQGKPWAFDNQDGAPDLGQCFAAIDPGCFAPNFQDRVSECLQYWRALEPVDPALPVLAPGDKEKKNAAQTHQRGSVFYAENQIESCNKMANRLGIKPLKTV